MFRLQRIVTGGAALVLGFIFLGVLPSSPASANTIPNGPTDPHFCSDYGQTSAGSFDGILACTGPDVGEITFHGTGGAIIESDSSGFQCVELATRYLYAQYGLPVEGIQFPVSDPNGYKVVSNYWNYIQSHSSAHYPLKLVTPSSATAGSLAPGDVVSYGNNADGEGGHVDIVTATSPSHFDGNGTITTLNENDAGKFTLKVTNWQFGLVDFDNNYMAATGWLHYTGAPAPAEQLWDYTQATGAKGPIGDMMAGTSPSIATLPNGGWVAAYQGATGRLFTASSSGAGTGPDGDMKAGTSPSIASLPNGGWVAAYQGASGRLFTASSSGAGTGPDGDMMAGTSPSITALSNGGWVAAYQGPSGRLFTASSSGAGTGPDGDMKAGTSPSITATSATVWAIAYQGASGRLFTASSSGAGTGPDGDMKAGTSPSITALSSGGWVAAYQGASGRLFTASSSGAGTGPDGDMMAGTSPSITATSATAWTIAYQGASSNMWEYNSSGTSVDSVTTMAAGTSPGSTALTNGRDEVAVARS